MVVQDVRIVDLNGDAITPPSNGDTHIVKAQLNGMLNGQVTLSTTTKVIIEARLDRDNLILKNLDAAITIYFGANGSPTLTSTNSMPLKAGESIQLSTTAAIQALAASGTPVLAWIELF